MTGNDLGNSLFIGNEAVLFFCSSCLSDNPAGIKNPVKQCYSRILKELIAAETALICANKILKQRMPNTVEGSLQKQQKLSCRYVGCETRANIQKTGAHGSGSGGTNPNYLFLGSMTNSLAVSPATTTDSTVLWSSKV